MKALSCRKNNPSAKKKNAAHTGDKMLLPTLSFPKRFNDGKGRETRCEGESVQPEGRLEEDLMAAHFTVCPCCHLIYAEAIAIHTSFYILSFQGGKKNSTFPTHEKKKNRKAGVIFMHRSSYLTTTSGTGNRAGQTDIVTLIERDFRCKEPLEAEFSLVFVQRVKLFSTQLFGMPLSDS